MRVSPLLSAAAAAALIASVAGPATAQTEPLPAAGVASSSVTLLDIAASGRSISAGTLALLTDALGAEALAQILVTPLTVDGTPYGQREVTPADGPSVVNPFSSAAVPGLSGLLGVTSPAFSARATEAEDGPSARAGSDSLGGLTLLGLPIGLDGNLDVGSAVSSTTGALGEKTFEVTDLALPSIADVLAALGLDLAKLPIEVLNQLVTQLDLLTPAITTAKQALDAATAQVQTQIDSAQAAVDKATADLAAATQELAGKNSELAAAEQQLAAQLAALAPLQTAVDDAQAQLTAANAELAEASGLLTTTLAGLGYTLAEYEALPELLKAPLRPVVDPLIAAVAAAQTAVNDATALVTQTTTALAEARSLADVTEAAVELLRGAVATLQNAVDGLQAILDAALAALDSILSTLLDEISALLGAITAVLDGTPLLSIDSLAVVTESRVTSAEQGGQVARITGGEVQGLQVLGTDVLQDVLGVTRIDLLELTGGVLNSVNGLVGELTGTLSSVLSNVPQFPTLSIPAPNVELMSAKPSTSIVDGFGLATTQLRALVVTLPSITLPPALALPGAADLPALSGLPSLGGNALRANAVNAAGDLLSSPVTLAVGTMAEQARFRPAAAGTPGTVVPPPAGTPTTGTPTTGTPTTGTPTTFTPVASGPLPRTGSSVALAVLAAVLMGGAVALRRRELVAPGGDQL